MSEDSCCGTWPEQNAVDAWLVRHNITVDHKEAMELKSEVTKYRIEQQKQAEYWQRMDESKAIRMEALAGKCKEAEAEVERLRAVVERVAMQPCSGLYEGYCKEAPCMSCQARTALKGGSPDALDK